MTNIEPLENKTNPPANINILPHSNKFKMYHSTNYPLKLFAFCNGKLEKYYTDGIYNKNGLKSIKKTNILDQRTNKNIQAHKIKKTRDYIATSLEISVYNLY